MTYIERLEKRLKEAKKIAKDWKSGKYTQNQLAVKYGMPRTSIQNIIK